MNIPLRNKEKNIVDYAIVSISDYENVNKYRWNRRVQITKTNKNEKKYVKSKINGKYITLHQFLLGKKENMIIDHINGNGLDNRRDNLRFLTISQNNQNRIKKENSSSKYIGVSFDKNRWKVGFSDICLGYFDNEEEAGKQYDTFVLLNTNGIAKTNNLVKYENVKNIDINNLIFKKNRKNDLPKNIIIDGSKYKVSIMYNRKVYTSEKFYKLENAIKELSVIKDKIQKVKQNENDQYKLKSITRNENNQAIITVNDLECVVDDDKWHELSQIKWNKEKSGYINSYINKTMILMHRYLLNPSKNEIVDHINNIRHDNRISNLRIVSPSINAHNKVKKQNCSSKYTGVSFNKKSKKWISYINFNSKQIRIGEFNIELDAAKAYNKKAIELYKENANLNKIE
jgi:hypothetical protein